MELNKFKTQNFWLKIWLTGMIVIWILSLAVMNNGIIKERKELNDSLSYYKKLSDSLRSDVDSLFYENGEFNNWDAHQQLMIYYLSQYNPKYKHLEKDLDKQDKLLK